MADAGTTTDAPAEAEPDEPAETDERREAIVAELREHLGDVVVDSHVAPGRGAWVRVTAEAWEDTARIARDRGEFSFFDFLSAIDWMPSPYGRYEDDAAVDPTEAWPPAMPDPSSIVSGYAGGDTRFQMLACLARPGTDLRILLKADVPDDTLTVPTWIHLFAGAAWHEREVHEMYGIGFDGNPDLRNLYLPGGFEGHPLRKDFPLLARVVKPWPGIVDVEPMPGEPEGDSEAEGEGE